MPIPIEQLVSNPNRDWHKVILYKTSLHAVVKAIFGFPLAIFAIGVTLSYITNTHLGILMYDATVTALFAIDTFLYTLKEDDDFFGWGNHKLFYMAISVLAILLAINTSSTAPIPIIFGCISYAYINLNAR